MTERRLTCVCGRLYAPDRGEAPCHTAARGFGPDVDVPVTATNHCANHARYETTCAACRDAEAALARWYHEHRHDPDVWEDDPA